MITIRNTNERYGWPVETTGETLEKAIQIMQDGLRSCGPEFTDIVVSDKDYEIVSASEAD